MKNVEGKVYSEECLKAIAPRLVGRPVIYQGKVVGEVVNANIQDTGKLAVDAKISVGDVPQVHTLRIGSDILGEHADKDADGNAITMIDQVGEHLTVHVLNEDVAPAPAKIVPLSFADKDGKPIVPSRDQVLAAGWPADEADAVIAQQQGLLDLWTKAHAPADPKAGDQK